MVRAIMEWSKTKAMAAAGEAIGDP